MNSRNDRIWTVKHSTADTKGGLRQKRKFPQKVMVWFGVCSKGVSSLVIFEDGTLNQDRYIKDMLSAVLKFGNDMFTTDWTFQQDSAKARIHSKSQEWCAKHFPCLSLTPKQS